MRQGSQRGPSGDKPPRLDVEGAAALRERLWQARVADYHAEAQIHLAGACCGPRHYALSGGEDRVTEPPIEIPLTCGDCGHGIALLVRHEIPGTGGRFAVFPTAKSALERLLADVDPARPFAYRFRCRGRRRDGRPCRMAKAVRMERLAAAFDRACERSGRLQLVLGVDV